MVGVAEGRREALASSFAGLGDARVRRRRGSGGHGAAFELFHRSSERGGAGAGRPRAARDRRQSASDLAVLDVGLGSGGALGMSFAWKVQRALAASGVSSLRFRQPAEESQRSGFTGKEGLLRSWALARIAVISGVGAPPVSC